jgi:hypothetical protein
MTSRPCGHDLGGCSAADVEEVGGLHAAVLLTRVGDDVEGRHDEPGAVSDDADLTVELDVVEVVLLGLRLERVCGILPRALAWFGWRKPAFSSSETLPSRAMISPSSVSTSGLTSTSVASSPL